MLEVRQETSPDYAETASLAAAAFDLPSDAFRPDRLRWLYERAFHYGSTIFGLFMGPQKVGQVVLVHQRVSVGDEVTTAVALFDLFISKAHRSRDAIAALYGAVESFCLDENIRFIVGVPNESGARVNIRHLRLAPVRRLDLRAGLTLPHRARRVVLSSFVTAIEHARAIELLDRYVPLAGTGMHWTADSLWDRLSGGFTPFALHATENLLLVSSLRTTRGLKHTLLCGFFAESRQTPARREVAALTSAACLLHKRPLYVYAGCHDGVPLPGVTLPDALRPSPLTVQIRDLAKPDATLQLNHFELLDFDFA